MDKKAEMGMGTLIIFIAMILVASVAAGVLISTTSTLQNKALAVGRAASQEVGTSLSSVDLYAENATSHYVEYFFLTTKLSAGSNPVSLADTLVTFNLHNTSKDYRYDSSVDCNDTTTINSDDGFGVDYQITGTGHKDDYLIKGDVMVICLKSTRRVFEGETISLTLIPMVGMPLRISTTAPDIMVDKRVALFP